MGRARKAIASKGGAVLAAALGGNSPEPVLMPLSNRKDLAGWKVAVKDNGHWKVVDGAGNWVSPPAVVPLSDIAIRELP